MALKQCALSGKEFEISKRDLEFYEKLGAPEPTLHPAERARRRMSYRNERNLYKSKCAFSGEPFLSMYHPDDGYTVYKKDIWNSDKWDATSYRRDFDFGRSAFEQFAELQKAVPRANLAIFTNNENSDYCNYVGDVKNSYLCFGSIFIEDCMYGNPYYSKNCVDCFLVRKSELCYECVDCEGLYNCVEMQDCMDCKDSSFGFDLKGCRDCFGCVGLRNKQYHIFNKKYSREDYEKFMGEFSYCDKEKVKYVRERLGALKLEHPHRGVVSLNCENCTGNFLFNSKGCEDCFQIMENEDCSYNIQTTTSKDCYDMNYTEENELCYEYLGNYRNYKAAFSLLCYGCSDVWYCDYLMTNCKDCFGCVGLKNRQFCILNKQYSQEEYEELVPRIIEKMKADGEWGEFFPASASPFCYNESVAADYFPLSREEALGRGYRWREDDKAEFRDGMGEVPERIEDVDDSICQEVLKCEVSGRNYRIMPAELKFYRKMRLPVPQKHFFERLRERLAKRTAYEVVARKCDKCGVEMKSAYGAERPEKVYCEQCYLAEVY